MDWKTFDSLVRRWKTSTSMSAVTAWSSNSEEGSLRKAAISCPDAGRPFAVGLAAVPDRFVADAAGDSRSPASRNGRTPDRPIWGSDRCGFGCLGDRDDCDSHAGSTNGMDERERLSRL